MTECEKCKFFLEVLRQITIQTSDSMTEHIANAAIESVKEK